MDDAASAIFARLFYKALTDMPPAAALASAQERMRNEEGYAAPYYWAGYQVLGAQPTGLEAQ